jgi:SNF2 family DNA or RNA helicase
MSSTNNNNNNTGSQPIRKPKSAFLFYQGAHLANILAEMGSQAKMGEAMTMLSNRWRSLSDEERQPYLDQHEQDVARYERESHEADLAALAAVEEKRKAQTLRDGEVHSQRGARSAMEEERKIREEKRRLREEAAAEDMSEEAIRRRELAALKKKEAQERRAKREEQEKALAKQHQKIDREEAKKAAQRFEYLLQQSNIFAKLQGGGKHHEQAKKQAKGVDKAHHLHTAESAGEEEEEEEEEEARERHVFLTKQPSCIKHGQLKSYQVESLNWMIHLAEKGLNGILADEMGLVRSVPVARTACFQNVLCSTYRRKFTNAARVKHCSRFR